MNYWSDIPTSNKPALWYPPQQAGFGPWFEHDGSENPPVEGDLMVHALLSTERGERKFKPEAAECQHWAWWSGIAAYCVELRTAKADKIEPTAAEVEATQKPETPTLDVMEDEHAANAAMIKRDEPTEAPVAAGEDPLAAVRGALDELIEFASEDAVSAGHAIPGGLGCRGPNVSGMERRYADVLDEVRKLLAPRPAEPAPVLADASIPQGLMAEHRPGDRWSVTP